jgi:hypothetical protein
MKFTYLKTSLNRYTFSNTKIRSWVEHYAEGRVLNLFAGKTLLNCDEVRNDLDPTMNADYHLDALQFCNAWNGTKFNTVLLDPPFAYRKSMEMYNGVISSPFRRIKDSILDILTENGIVITFGYHSVVMGKRRGFKQEHILLLSHGGAIHDTIAVIERRMKSKPNLLE